MSYLSVNGIELHLPVAPEAPFQDLIIYLRKSLTSETVLISSVRVNGNEVNQPDEERLATTPISELDSVEVVTRHPKELVHEILQDMLGFTSSLADLCLKTADSAGQTDFYLYLTRLIDGISYLTEGVTQVKKILRIGSFAVTDVLEADLLSILKDLLSYQQKGQQEYMVDLMRDHLLLNLEQWRSEGVPALIRSRDS